MLNRILFLLLLASTAWADGASNWITGTTVITRDDGSLPALGSSYTDSTTGATITRRSNIASMGSAYNGQIVYSRFSPLNSNGQYLLVHGTNSTSAYVWRLSDNTMVTDLKRDESHQIGETANETVGGEIRWDYSGSYPNRIYFVYGLKFYYMDAISGNGSPTLIHDFATEFPTANHIANSVEGDSSSDSRYWAWVVWGPYDGGLGDYPALKIITYDKQTDTILGQIDVGDVTPTQNAENWTTRLPEPNMVEIVPDGSGVHLNFTKCYVGSTTADWCGTAFDSPRVFQLNFSDLGTAGVRVSNDEDHSGWGWVGSKPVFVTKNGSTDKMQACYADGTGGAFPNNCFNFYDYAAMGYANYHVARMPASKPGWTLLSTYYGDNTNWAYNQLLMIELKAEGESPTVWRVSPNYNTYGNRTESPLEGNYRNEASAAIDLNGDKIYWTGNWGDVNHGEALEIDLPDAWCSHWGATCGGAYGAGILVNTGGTALHPMPGGAGVHIIGGH